LPEHSVRLASGLHIAQFRQRLGLATVPGIGWGFAIRAKLDTDLWAQRVEGVCPVGATRGEGSGEWRVEIQQHRALVGVRHIQAMGMGPTTLHDLPQRRRVGLQQGAYAHEGGRGRARG
jgi:hypothetical protein